MNIYVGNLPPEITADELRGEFTAFGEVTTVTIMNDKYIGSGQPKCYGFVEMTSKSAGTVAVTNLNGKKLRNRVVDVVEALPLDKRGPERRSNSYKNRPSKSRQRSYQTT